MRRFLLAWLLAACVPAESGPSGAVAAAECLTAENAQERMAACTVALNDDGNTPRVRSMAYAHRGSMRERAGYTEAALSDYDDALRLYADNPNALLWRARLLVDMNQLDAAEPSLRRAIDVHQSGIANGMMGEISLRRADYQSAIGYFTAALERAPRHTESLIGRAQAKQCLGDRVGARTDFDAAVQLGAVLPTETLECATRGQ